MLFLLIGLVKIFKKRKLVYTMPSYGLLSVILFNKFFRIIVGTEFESRENYNSLKPSPSVRKVGYAKNLFFSLVSFSQFFQVVPSSLELMFDVSQSIPTNEPLKILTCIPKRSLETRKGATTDIKCVVLQLPHALCTAHVKDVCTERLGKHDG